MGPKYGPSLDIASPKIVQLSNAMACASLLGTFMCATHCRILCVSGLGVKGRYDIISALDHLLRINVDSNLDWILIVDRRMIARQKMHWFSPRCSMFGPAISECIEAIYTGSPISLIVRCSGHMRG